MHNSPLRIVLLQTEARVALVAISKPEQSVDAEVQLLPKLLKYPWNKHDGIKYSWIKYTVKPELTTTCLQ